MIIDTKTGDGPTLTIAAELLLKGCKAASQATEKIGLSTMAIDELQGHGEILQERVQEYMAETGELPLEIELTPPLVEAAKVGLSLMLTKITKVEEEQIDLAIETAETVERRNRTQNLWDRLNGQTELALEVAGGIGTRARQ
ncbi:MAG TPA: hypothetical protein VFN76_09760 [Candidatus Limnocylindria bacterium]|nr:hypothetical protein [Candidatus Limnocylindria bacterium]